MSPAEGRFTLGLLAMDGAMPSCYTGVMDLLKIAHKLAQLRDPATTLKLETVLVGARGQATINLDGGLVMGPVHSPDRALDLLQRTTRPIKQVAEAAGFQNQKSFMRAFKGWTGVTPGEWREQQPAVPARPTVR